MKTKNFKKKLRLNKKTIANLGDEVMAHVYGGIIQPCSDFSYCNQDSCENCTSNVPIETCGGPSICDVCQA
ncbi:MAG: hypothetical protein GTO45_07905 [Candidatus Aminicenantes bacterium]|nr:hypothetical protein [Candidatus Aminicenantes bacterium]NIM78754.1 hypothetical protein [Candidatus Aminicenantes bacterium]NIN18009.1 hypothetical protein [Candidatus Aminicenantes bacterium]NIN41909.1 hypothetical protein [Candidatus Aminicenantes bacterium]NIN84664.1 hypothetical protein [Candidatus Aminicenantes bacterium]